MESLLEILKITIPGLIVFATAYFLLKNYLDNQLQLKVLDEKSQNKGQALQNRLQAYERLTLLCERLSIPNLLWRLNNLGANAETMNATLLLAIQQEFEHNVTQQLYVSDKLWQIIAFARNEMVALVSRSYDKLEKDSSIDQFKKTLMEELKLQKSDPLETAKKAIKIEAGLLF